MPAAINLSYQHKGSCAADKRRGGLTSLLEGLLLFTDFSLNGRIYRLSAVACAAPRLQAHCLACAASVSVAMALTGWSPPALQDSPLKDVSVDSMNSPPQRPRQHWQAMALNAREVPPLPTGGNSQLAMALVDKADDIPFDDDRTSIAVSSNRSADLAIFRGTDAS